MMGENDNSKRGADGAFAEDRGEEWEMQYVNLVCFNDQFVCLA